MPGQSVGLSQVRRGQCLHVVNRTRGSVVASRLHLALDPLRRMRGLLARPPLGPGEGLLLIPCSGVHTLFMRYPIDVLFVGDQGEVVALRSDLRPWRLTPLFARACAALELLAGEAVRSGTQVDDLLGFEYSHCQTPEKGFGHR